MNWTEPMNITVAISTRERPEALKRCLEALAAGQRLPAEIVVVDQSRDRRTADLLAGCRLAPVELVYIPQASSGLGKAQNLAFATARCPVIAVIDDDCVPQEDWIATIEQAFAAEGGVDVLTGRILPLGPAEPGLYPVALRTSTQRVTFGPSAMPWEIGSGNNFVARRSLLERIGGNDERLGPGSPGQGGVDMDLFYRLLRAGGRIRYEPDLVVYHEQVDRAGRMARRSPYGYGMGACSVLWLRQGDRNALRVLGRWFLMRLERLAQAVRPWDGLRVREELQVLRGTLSGLKYGWQQGGKNKEGGKF